MEKALRIKSASWLVQIGIPIIVLSVIAGAIGLVLGEITLLFVLACLFLAAMLLHLIFLVRMKNPAYFIPLGFYLLAALTFSSVPLDNDYLTGGLAVLSGLFFMLFLGILFKRKIKWRYREILELAARSVRSTEDGFTPRPFPAGKIQVQPPELSGFSNFLLKYGIAWQLTDGEKLVFVIPRNMLVYLLGLKKDFQKATYVAIDQEGQLTVKISEKDYSQYQQEFTFDQLCAALGNLFVDFLDQYKNGQSHKIIERMNSLKFVV